MAIDTEDKRMSMLSWHSGRRIPQPDGSIDQNDRQTLLGRYGGILWLEGIWTIQTPDSTMWSDQTPDNSIWTDQTPDGTMWADS